MEQAKSKPTQLTSQVLKILKQVHVTNAKRLRKKKKKTSGPQTPNLAAHRLSYRGPPHHFPL